MAIGTTAFPTSLDTVVELVEVKNNASSTLSGNVLIGDVTIGVTDIAEFPTTGFGTLTDDLTTPTKTEIISWTGISGSNLTGCTRGAQGTSAAAFSSGNFIEVRPTAGHHEALRGAVIAIETKLGTGTAIAVNKLAALTASRLMVTDASGFASAASVTATEAGYLSGVTSAIQTQLNAKGAGDVVGPASATDDAIARFDLTTGKLIQNSVVTIADTTGNMAGVGTLNTHTIPAGTDTFVLLAANQTLTTKTLTSPDINGGTADSLTSLSVRSTGAAFDLLFANAEVLTGNKTLTFKVNDTSRTIDLAGNLTLAAAFSTSGANALTLTTTGATDVTLPTTGTLVNSAVTSLSSLTTVGTITSGGLSTGAVLGGVTITLGSDADGDIYYRSSNVLTRLPKGTALQQLRMNAGATAPEWAAAAGGGGITIGTTAITSGTAGRILYEASGNVVGETAGFTYQPAASPNLTITAQAASYVGLRINSASSPSANMVEITNNGTNLVTFYSQSSNRADVRFFDNGTDEVRIFPTATGGIYLTNSNQINFGGTGAAYAVSSDVAIARATAGVLSIQSQDAAQGRTLRFVANSATQITANQDNYTAGTVRSYFQRWSSDASRDVTGFSNSQVDGQVHLVVNVGSFDIVLKHESASSTAANRFTNSTGADITLTPNQAADLIYSGTTSRWLVFKRN